MAEKMRQEAERQAAEAAAAAPQPAVSEVEPQEPAAPGGIGRTPPLFPDRRRKR
jgi:hypothetical protein